LRPHAHGNAIEICFLERGEQTYRVGGRLHRLRGSDQFFTLPGEVHDSANLPQERGILYWLILSLDPSSRLLNLAPAAARELCRALKEMPTRHFRGHPNCARLLGEITRWLGTRQNRTSASPGFRRLRLQALFLEYLTLTIAAAQSGSHGATTPLIRRVLQHIETHLADPIHVPELARVARLSTSRLKVRFKRELGVPPAEFWLRQKIERAVVLLETKPVTEVAFALGFSSSQYFATAFRRYTLLRPSEIHLRPLRAKKQ
jgi:AraC-like DNA-binding protein